MPSSRGSSWIPGGLNSALLHCSEILYHLSHQGSPFNWYVFFFLIILFMTVLVFTACGPSLVAENGAYSLVAAQGLLTVVASLVAEMGSRA